MKACCHCVNSCMSQSCLNSPKNHWSNYVGCGMDDCLDYAVMEKTHGMVKKAKLISISCDKVTTTKRNHGSRFTLMMLMISKGCVC